MSKLMISELNATSLELQPKIHYTVSMPQPQNHLFEVTLNITNYPNHILDLKMPVWTPGSYLVREYARHLQDFYAFSKNQSLRWQKISKNHWQITKSDFSEITIKYRIFANELTVRTNHLDATHGYFNGAALFFRIPNYQHLPINITIIPPDDKWHVTTALPKIANSENSFLAADFDTLVDSPFEIGSHQLHQFSVLGKSHQLAMWGKGNFQVSQMITDFEKIINVESEMFAGLPYDQYIFFLHLLPQAYGGLEHKDSCCLIYDNFGFRNVEKYHGFLQLVAHEFFHLWNVKRIRPQGLEVFDYDQENYTPSLWFCEGTTSYYDLVIPQRAGIYDAKAYLHYFSKEITRYLLTPGKRVQPLSESSFDAWIKLYRPDANSGNSQISYYIKGEMVSFLLDLLIRNLHHNRRSLDDVMRIMWEKFGKDEVGYEEEELQAIIADVAGKDLTDFFNLYLHGLSDLPFNDYLRPFGLQLVGDKGEHPYLGLRINDDNGRDMIKFVELDSPAYFAGLNAGDELLAIDGVRIKNNLAERLKDYRPNDKIEVTVFHQDQLISYDIILTEPVSKNYELLPLENVDKMQEENFLGWLGAPLSSLK
ncbi:M61 family metallopeptidase [Anabaena sp. FACHB-1237]|uniref:M61 family metallopeptidase n=1 Tax=Anabaena sp. FACHB-1237 TaxID=2692769 RepID=UPI001681A14D|nr:M61 family metallopeptidase [Anabaena sp. FACHB-1237]MBD2138755.1 M61 family metallopeptidase [Anabaena sp. FACHB-1237]